MKIEKICYGDTMSRFKDQNKQNSNNHDLQKRDNAFKECLEHCIEKYSNKADV